MQKTCGIQCSNAKKVTYFKYTRNTIPSQTSRVSESRYPKPEIPPKSNLEPIISPRACPRRCTFASQHPWRYSLFVEIRHQCLAMRYRQVEYRVCSILGRVENKAWRARTSKKGHTTRLSFPPTMMDPPSSSVHASALQKTCFLNSAVSGIFASRTSPFFCRL
jgi:hypothetical protein